MPPQCCPQVVVCRPATWLVRARADSRASSVGAALASSSSSSLSAPRGPSAAAPEHPGRISYARQASRGAPGRCWRGVVLAATYAPCCVVAEVLPQNRATGVFSRQNMACRGAVDGWDARASTDSYWSSRATRGRPTQPCDRQVPTRIVELLLELSSLLLGTSLWDYRAVKR